MIDLKYSLVIEATDDPSFSFYSPETGGFTGVDTPLKIVYTRPSGAGGTSRAAERTGSSIPKPNMKSHCNRARTMGPVASAA